MRVLVVTIVHNPLDARIFHREITALLDAGHEVIYVAPWSGYGLTPPVRPGLETVDVARAGGRRRFAAWLGARRRVAALRARADVMLLHDPELVVAVAFEQRPPTVWDVHEDTVATLVDKPWLPARLRAPLRAVVRRAERLAERRMALLFAEAAYRDNFARDHPVVPNEPVVPESVAPAGEERVVYLGRVSRGRGADVLLALPGLLPRGVRLVVIGPADADVAPRFTDADRAGVLDWAGFMPNNEAHTLLDGALAGLSLLRDLPNYRHSRPTKIVEYMARGVPVITTPTPIAAEIVQTHDAGAVVPFDDAGAVANVIEQLHANGALRQRYATNGHRAALMHFNWRNSAPGFVAALERLAGVAAASLSGASGDR